MSTTPYLNTMSVHLMSSMRTCGSAVCQRVQRQRGECDQRTRVAERKTGVKHAEVVTARLAPAEHAWLRLASEH